MNLANVLVVFVAALHVVFLILEMFLWQKPVGMKIFGLTPETAALTAPLAKNQGLYNGFLAAGLIWSFFAAQPESIQTFFLLCIIVAGIFGAITAKPSILFVQALPAVIALLAVYFSSARAT